jgi:hypothetical protein
MSSPNTSFLETHILYNKILSHNKELKKYELEIKYIKEEIQYWKTDSEINPSEIKTKKISDLKTELENIENIYLSLKNYPHG